MICIFVYCIFCVKLIQLSTCISFSHAAYFGSSYKANSAFHPSGVGNE